MTVLGAKDDTLIRLNAPGVAEVHIAWRVITGQEASGFGAEGLYLYGCMAG